jgi:serine/threonine-protein kinase
MAPEQVHGKVTLHSDVFAMGIVAWEALTGQALFAKRTDAETLAAVLGSRIDTPSERGAASDALDAVVMKSLDRRVDHRFASAMEMARAIEAALSVASAREVAEWVEHAAGAELQDRAARIRQIEREYPALPVPRRDVEATATIVDEAQTRPLRHRGRRVVVGAIALAALAGTFALAVRPRAADEARRGPSLAPSEPRSPEPEVSAEPVIGVQGLEPDASLPAAASRARNPPRPRTKVPAHGSDPCNPPYTVDENTGRHTYKHECF